LLTILHKKEINIQRFPAKKPGFFLCLFHKGE
jgi:hypothetical protein